MVGKAYLGAPAPKFSTHIIELEVSVIGDRLRNNFFNKISVNYFHWILRLSSQKMINCMKQILPYIYTKNYIKNLYNT